MESRFLQVPDGLDGTRADAGIARILGLSRSAVTSMITSGGAVQDGRVLEKSDRLIALAHLDLTWAAREEPKIVATDVDALDIVHEDADIVVVDKPAGVAAHPSLGWSGPSVVGVLAARGVEVATSGAAERQGVVHRLDAGTSGLMVVAKSERAYTRLKAAFRDREVEKIYHTAVQGHPDPLLGTIDAPVGRHPGHEWRFAVVSTGKHAVTHYDTLEAHRAGSLLSVKLETGRTHQIRVHMAARKHPCLGDTMYGADAALAERLGLDRQWLHAVRLGFRHPGTGAQIEFQSGYPGDLQEAIDMVRAM